MRILWIDDEIDLLRPFIYALRDKGYEVETATNGLDGLELAQQREFDLVLLDQIMAGMQGLEVLRRLKQTDPNLLVTMVTKSDDEAVVNEAYGDMVDDFLIKPFTPAQLLAVLKRLLDKRRLVAERMGQQFMAAMNQSRDLSTWPAWVEYCRSLFYWQNVLGRYGDAALNEIQEDRWQRANEEFTRFVLAEYKRWLTAKSQVTSRGLPVSDNTPVLSHRFIEEFVRPHWEDRPTYLLVFDSMRLDQWEAITPLLRDYFEVETRYYCALLPSATPYARNAIFSGLLPLDILRQYPQYWVFDESGQNRFEKELLTEYLRRLRFTGRFTFVKAPSSDDLQRERGALLDSGVRFTVLVFNFLDQLIHSVKTTQVLDEIIPNDQALVAMTRVWFSSSAVFTLLKSLARLDCRVVITSDHGFIRVKRPTVIHGGREISPNLRYKFGGALRVDERTALLLREPAVFALPAEHTSSNIAIAFSDYYFIYPTKLKQYEKTYKMSYQHGGISLGEMVVPVATLRPR
ncbi:MAG: response regulator [candidate division WOR-3 bacterium]